MSNKVHKNSPPIFLQKLFLWWCSGAEIEDLMGDMEENYFFNLEQKGKWKAQIIYFKQALSLSFSYSLSQRKKSAQYSSYYNSNSLSMFNNYFKIALRNFSKHKLFTTINILGLALGMSLCLLTISISLAIYKSDDFHDHKDRIYQINTRITDDSDDSLYGSTFNAVGDFIAEGYPFIEKTVKIKENFRPTFQHHGNELGFRGYFAGVSFFEVFSFQLISGNPHTALAEPFSIVLTESVAKKLYRDSEPLGKILETESGSYTVTGVMPDIKQTHFNFQVLASMSTFKKFHPLVNQKLDWENYRNNYVYVLLKKSTSKEPLEVALTQTSTTAEAFYPTKRIALQAIELDQVVPRWNISNAIGIGWDQPTLIFMMALGLLLLIPAVFNYTNLSIARALKRAKEIGIRKVMGAEKNQIKAQFIIETVVLTFMALLGSLLIYDILMNEFLNMLISGSILDVSMSFTVISVFVIFTLVIGILSGIFPALYFSRLNPIETLKGEIQSRSSSISGIRKGLFVFQFFVSLVLIIGVGVIAKQYAYVFNHNHGFESNNILVVPIEHVDKQLVITELGRHPDVKSITTSSNLPGVYLPNMQYCTPNDVDTMAVSGIFIGDGFIDKMQMKLAWGESENLKHSNKSEEFVLVNEQFMQSISVYNVQKDSLSFTLSDGTKCRVIGVLEDFNFEPLNALINPLMFRYSIEKSNYALLSIASPDIRQTIDELDAVWSTIDQNGKFEPVFLDDEIEKAYKFLAVQIKIFSFLSSFAITISCLGLLGMVAYSTENRTKEIAIRKIMGASSFSLYYLLTKEFVKLIAISASIAIPFSYLFYDKLFLRFLIRYGSGLGVVEVLVSILFLFLVGFISIYWQTSKVTNTNPAENLRHE